MLFSGFGGWHDISGIGECNFTSENVEQKSTNVDQNSANVDS